MRDETQVLSLSGFDPYAHDDVIGLNPGSTPGAYYSLWIPISSVDTWSPCFHCWTINDYSRAPAEFPEEEGSELLGHQPIVGFGAVDLNSGEAWRRNEGA